MEEQQRKSAKGWMVLAIVNLFLFFSLFQANMLNALSASLIKKFAFSSIQIGFFTSIFFYTSAALIIPAGVILDNVSTRKIVLIGIVLDVFATFLLIFAINPFMAITARFLAGACHAFAFLCCARIAMRWLPVKQISLGIGITISIGMVAGMMAQAPFALLISWLDWRVALFIFNLIGVVAIILIAIYVYDAPPHDSTSTEPQHQFSDPLMVKLRRALRNRENWLSGIYVGLITLPTSLLGVGWGILYLTKARHIPLFQASLLTTLLFLGLMASLPFLGWLAEKVNLRRLMLIGAVLTTISLIPLIWMVNLSILSLVILFLVLGTLSGFQTVTFSYVDTVNLRDVTSTAMAIAIALYFFAIATVQPLYGYLIKHGWFNWIIQTHNISQTTVRYQNGLIILIIASVISFIVVLMMKGNKD